MIYLRRFNEGVIKPYNFDECFSELGNIENITIDDINRIFNQVSVEFVDVIYFKSKLQTNKEIELVPENMPSLFGGVRFAAHNVYTNIMYICIIEDVFISSINRRHGKEKLIEFLNEILRHESIHKQQAEKRPNVTIRNLENSPVNPTKYFSSTDEIMAYAQTFIDQCRQRKMSDGDIIQQLKSKRGGVSWVDDVYSKLPFDVIKRFKKYVYKYITD